MGAPDFIDTAARKLPRIIFAPGPLELGVGDGGQRLGHQLGDGGGGRGRGVGAGQRERGHDQRLAGAGIDPQRADHGGVPDQGRVAVDQAHHDRVVVDELLAEHDLAHAHRVLRRGRGG